MILDLDKDDLISLVNGCDANIIAYRSDYTIATNLIKSYGGFDDRYFWDTDKLKQLTEEELLEVYNLCKAENMKR